jgi:hypothetical protein
VKDHILALPKQEQPTPLQLSNSNGKLYLINGPRPIELFATKLDNDGCIQVMAIDTNLMQYNILPETYDAWIKDAVASAARFASR